VVPLIFLLLFRYAFGSALGAGIGGSYINYLTSAAVPEQRVRASQVDEPRIASGFSPD
jgi:hypothetical protein